MTQKILNIIYTNIYEGNFITVPILGLNRTSWFIDEKLFNLKKLQIAIWKEGFYA